MSGIAKPYGIQPGELPYPISTVPLLIPTVETYPSAVYALTRSYYGEAEAPASDPEPVPVSEQAQTSGSSTEDDVSEYQEYVPILKQLILQQKDAEEKAGELLAQIENLKAILAMSFPSRLLLYKQTGMAVPTDANLNLEINKLEKRYAALQDQVASYKLRRRLILAALVAGTVVLLAGAYRLIRGNK